MTQKLLMGNEAFAHAALEAGVNVVAGYPGTPSSELIETVAALVAQGKAHDVHVEWSTNEKAALELLAGASYCGARVLFTCKQVGLNVASDALMSLNYVGVKGGCVLFVADDPGPISSQTEQDTRRFGAFAKVPVLDPSTPEEGFAMMKQAFELSERYACPVIVRPTTRINHASTYFDVADETHARPLPAEGFVKDPKWIIFPRRAYQAHGEINTRLAAMAGDFARDESWTRFNPVFETANSRPAIGIMAGGVSAAYTREALCQLEALAAKAQVELPSMRVMQVGTPYPFPHDAALGFVSGLDAVLVLEELDYVLEDELLRLAGRDKLAFDVAGKLTGHASDRGENSTDACLARICAFADERLGTSLASLIPAASPYSYPADAQALPVRPPVLCAGCPHRGSFYAVKRALGRREAVYCGDIGCYTLGNAAPLSTTDTCLCMGAGITVAQGFSVAEPHKKQVAFVGDSTFFASGLTGCANAVYNQHDVTVCVLDNATTAMTGKQPHPGTGVTLMGGQSKPIKIDAVLKALGFECIVYANPLDHAAAVAAAKEAIDFAGPSAIIFQSPCVQLAKPKPALAVDVQRCSGCKLCISSIGCPGIGFNPSATGPKSDGRGQAFVDAGQCNGCGLCAQICPVKAITRPCAADGEEACHA